MSKSNQSEKIIEDSHLDHDLKCLKKLLNIIDEQIDEIENADDMKQLLIELGNYCGGKSGLFFNDKHDQNTEYIRNKFGIKQRDPTHIKSTILIDFESYFKLHIILKNDTNNILNFNTVYKKYRQKFFIELENLKIKLKNIISQLDNTKPLKHQINNEQIVNDIVTQYYPTFVISIIKQESKLIYEIITQVIQDGKQIGKDTEYLIYRKLVIIGELCNDIKQMQIYQSNSNKLEIVSTQSKIRNNIIHQNNDTIIIRKSNYVHIQDLLLILQHSFTESYTIDIQKYKKTYKNLSQSSIKIEQIQQELFLFVEKINLKLTNLNGPIKGNMYNNFKTSFKSIKAKIDYLDDEQYEQIKLQYSELFTAMTLQSIEAKLSIQPSIKQNNDIILDIINEIEYIDKIKDQKIMRQVIEHCVTLIGQKAEDMEENKNIQNNLNNCQNSTILQVINFSKMYRKKGLAHEVLCLDDSFNLFYSEDLTQSLDIIKRMHYEQVTNPVTIQEHHQVAIAHQLNNDYKSSSYNIDQVQTISKIQQQQLYSVNFIKDDDCVTLECYTDSDLMYERFNINFDSLRVTVTKMDEFLNKKQYCEALQYYKENLPVDIDMVLKYHDRIGTADDNANIFKHKQYFQNQNSVLDYEEYLKEEQRKINDRDLFTLLATVYLNLAELSYLENDKLDEGQQYLHFAKQLNNCDNDKFYDNELKFRIIIVEANLNYFLDNSQYQISIKMLDTVINECKHINKYTCTQATNYKYIILRRENPTQITQINLFNSWKNILNEAKVQLKQFPGNKYVRMIAVYYICLVEYYYELNALSECFEALKQMESEFQVLCATQQELLQARYNICLYFCNKVVEDKRLDQNQIRRVLDVALQYFVAHSKIEQELAPIMFDALIICVQQNEESLQNYKYYPEILKILNKYQSVEQQKIRTQYEIEIIERMKIQMKQNERTE
ncbi:Hypothetical_protein [Hexamita inflata]|uniref:Hypothetical_protein n=1 Tax=Hexamita inflata TaxID=28002 RepID=A0AA86QA38_9EUKA|nr:Hypothetical protein HINF_LOCUS36774 [Hexamita inflata]